MARRISEGLDEGAVAVGFGTVHARRGALGRMTLEPARRLDAYVPSMRNKGRLRVGADADVTIFDPDTVVDRSTYTEPTLTPEGIPYVLVNGVLVVDEGRLVPDVRPGRAIRRDP